MEMEMELVISPTTILVNLGRACFMVALIIYILVVVLTGTKKKNINKVIQIVIRPQIAGLLG